MSRPSLSPKAIGSLGWLADAPLFIDREQVEAFYDAVVRPEGVEKKITLSLKSLEAEKTTLGGEVQAEISVSKWLTTIFPFLDAKVGGKTTAAAEEQSATEETKTIELQPMSSPQRQLVQLALHYALQLPSRMKVVSELGDGSWYETGFITAIPRALLFLEFPRGTAFIPMAAELPTGKVVQIYNEAARAFTGGEENPNPRPDERLLNPEAQAEAWEKYWRWFAEHFDSYYAMETVEKLVGDGGRLRWIDYRVPLPKAAKPLHIHISGRGEYDTGVFAYNLIRRGFRHGLRMVGTLKSAPDVNVLAIFEK